MSDTYLNNFDKKCKEVKKECVVNKKKTDKKTCQEVYYICNCFKKSIYICKPCYDDCHFKFCNEKKKSYKDNKDKLKILENFENSLKTTCKQDNKNFDSYCQCQTELSHDLMRRHQELFDDTPTESDQNKKLSYLIPYEAQLAEYTKYEYIDYNENGEDFFESEVETKRSTFETLFENHLISMGAASYLNKIKIDDISKNKNLIILLTKTLKNNTHYFFFNDNDNLSKLENFQISKNEKKLYDITKPEIGTYLFLFRKLYVIPYLIRKNKIFTTIYGYDENISFLHRKQLFQSSSDGYSESIFNEILILKDSLKEYFKTQKSEKKQEKSNDKTLLIIIKEFCKYVEILMNFELSDDEQKNKKFNKVKLEELLNSLIEIKESYYFDKDYYRFDQSIYMIQIKLVDYYILKNKLTEREIFNKCDNNLISREHLPKNLGKNMKFLELNKYERIFYKLKFFEEFYTQPLKHFFVPDYITKHNNKGDDDEEFKVEDLTAEIKNISRWKDENIEVEFDNISKLKASIESTFSPKNIIEKLCEHINKLKKVFSNKLDEEKKQIQLQLFYKGYTSQILGLYQFVTSNRFFVRRIEETKDFIHNDQGEIYNSFNFFISVNLKLLYMLIEHNELLIPLFFNTKLINLIFAQRRELSEEDLLEKKKKKEIKDNLIKRCEDDMINNREKEEEETLISDETKKEEKQQIDLEVYKNMNLNKKESLTYVKEKDINKQEDKTLQIRRLQEEISKLRKEKTPPSEILKALDFNNIITFYVEILKHLRKQNIKIDLTPLMKKLQYVSKINTEHRKIYGDREQNNQNFIKINETNIFCNILAPDNKEKQKKVFKFSLKLNSTILKVLEISYTVNSTIYKELSEHYILSTCCKVVDELNYYIFRSVRDNDIILERSREKVKELFSKLKDVYKDLPLQYKRLFKIADNFSSLHFLILSKMINGDFLTEQINLYNKNVNKKKSELNEISHSYFDIKTHKNEVQLFLASMIDFERELDIKYSKNFIKYYFKNLYMIKDSKALEESIQTSSKDVELDYMQIKILEEEERQKMIYFDGDYVPKKKVDKKVDFYILREIRNFLSLKYDQRLFFDFQVNNIQMVNIEGNNPLMSLISYYRDAIAYPMFQVIYNIVLTNIVEDNLKNTFSILYSFMKSLHHFLKLISDILKGLKDPEIEHKEILDNLFFSKNLEKYINSIKDDEKDDKISQNYRELEIYLQNNRKHLEEIEKMDMYTQLYTFMNDKSSGNKTIFNSNNLKKQEEDIKKITSMYAILIDRLSAQIVDELYWKFPIKIISEHVKNKEKVEKENEKKIRDGEEANKKEETKVRGGKEPNKKEETKVMDGKEANKNEETNEDKVYQLDNIFNKLFQFVYLFNFKFNDYDVNNDRNSKEEQDEENDSSEKNRQKCKINKELVIDVFSLKNSFSSRKKIEKKDDDDDDDKEKRNKLDKFFKDFSDPDEEEVQKNYNSNQETKQNGQDEKRITEQINSNEFKQDLFAFNISQDLEESDKPSFYNNIKLILHLYHDSPEVMQSSIIKYLPQEKKLNFFTFNYNNEIANVAYLIYLDLINFDKKEINDKYKEYFLKIVEFYRLLCEDHNANIQSILTDPNQNEIMDDFTKKLREDRKEEKKRNKIKKKILSLTSEDDKEENSVSDDSDDESDEEDNFKIDEEGNRIANKYTEITYCYNDKKEFYIHNDFEVKVKNPHKVGNNIVEVLVNLWININETLCYYKEKENFLKYIRVLNYKKIEDIIDKISEFLIEIIQGSYQENLEKITFEEGQPLNQLLKTIFKIIENITKNIPNSIEDDEKIKKNELSKLRKIMEFTLKKFMKFVIAYIEENENPDIKKSSVIKDIKPATIYSLIRYCIVKIYLKYGDEDHKNELEKYIHAKELEKLYKTNVEVGNDDLFELGSLTFQFMKISGSLSIKESQKFKRFINRLREESEALKEKEKDEFFMFSLKKEQFDQEKKKISLEKLNIQIYIFFEKIIQYIEISYVAARHHELLEGLNQYPNKKFLAKVHQKKIEENKEKCLQKVFFIGNYLTMFMNKQDTRKFIEDAPFLNFNQRLDYIFRKVNNYLDLINTRYYLCRNMSFVYEIHLIDYKNVTRLSVILAIMTNLILFFSLKVDNMWNFRLKSAIDFLGLFHVYILFLAILIWLAVNILIIKLKYSSIGNKYNSYKKLSGMTKIYKQVKNIVNLFGDRDLIPICLNFIFGFMAISDPQFSFFYALQLMAIFALYPTMMSVIIAIKMRYEQFLSSALLILILILFFSSVSFLYFRELYFSPDLNENVCDSFSHCFLTMLNNGIRSGSIGDFGNVKSIEDPLYWYYFIFSWIFYFIVILIMLNIINGIIIDTFQDLREQEEERDDCKENMCYVCSNRRSRFEMCGLNYEEHISEEHSIKEYLFYLIKNYLVNEHDLNAVDSYVLELTKNKRLDFFPIKTSINLEKLLDS